MAYKVRRIGENKAIPVMKGAILWFQLIRSPIITRTDGHLLRSGWFQEIHPRLYKCLHAYILPDYTAYGEIQTIEDEKR